jgi:hypothetical protein
MGEDFINQDRRDVILEGIREARGIASELDARASAIPPELMGPAGPMKADANRYMELVRNRAVLERQVSALESRLGSAGPMWPALTEAERKGLENYIAVVDNQAAILDRYFPTRTSTDAQKIGLLAVGIGALFSPLLWESEGSWSFRVPFREWKPAQPVQRRFGGEERRGMEFQRIPGRSGPEATPARTWGREQAATPATTFRGPQHGTFSVFRKPTA